MSIVKIKTADREEWKELRSHYIGGSDAAAVVGLNPYSSAYALWAEKTGLTHGFDGNLATEVGTYLEEFIAKKFETETGKKVRKVNQSFFNSEYPWAIANIDRAIVGEDAGLEIKSTDSLNLSKFHDKEYPANYYAQMVHYMAITGKSKWYLAVLIGHKEFRWYEIERDQAEIDALMLAESDLWTHVQEKTPPPVDGTEATSKTISAIYENSNAGETVDLLPIFKELQTFQEIKKQIETLEKIRDEAANKIKLYMGTANKGCYEDWSVSWTTSNRSTFNRAQFEKDNPHIDLSSYYKISKQRRFCVTEPKGV